MGIGDTGVEEKWRKIRQAKKKRDWAKKSGMTEKDKKRRWRIL